MSEVLSVMGEVEIARREGVIAVAEARAGPDRAPHLSEQSNSESTLLQHHTAPLCKSL